MSFAKLAFPPLSYVGPGAVNRLHAEVRKYAPSKIMLITDPVLQRIGVADRVTAPLRQAGLDVAIFDGVLPEPPLELAEQLVDRIRGETCDLVVGLGGGSALDLAKAAAVLAVHDGKVADYLNLTGTRAITRKGLPKILIPTTSGTGSEVTNIAVLSLENTKDVITHDYLLADAALVDPELTLTLPARVTAATGIDALTHAVEAYLSVHSSPTSDALALHAIRLAGRSLRRAVEHGQDIAARTDMSEASYLAGLAFFNGGVAGVHALAYPLGGRYHIAHGEANAVLLPYVTDYIRSSCKRRMSHILEALCGDSASLTEDEASVKCVETLFNLVKDVGIPTTLAEHGIPADALEVLVQDAGKQTMLLARSPMLLELKDIRTIYESAFQGLRGNGF